LFDFREKYELPFGRLGLPSVDEEEENEPEVTSELIANALEEYKGERTSFLIKSRGRNVEEDSVILIEDNSYKGFGFLNKEIQIETYQELENHIEVMSHSDFSMSVIYLFLSKNTAGEVIYLT
jgi:DNA polymerase-3 subunit epsilon